VFAFEISAVIVIFASAGFLLTSIVVTIVGIFHATSVHSSRSHHLRLILILRGLLLSIPWLIHTSVHVLDHVLLILSLEASSTHAGSTV
jgi:hypothetical protein